MIGKRLQRLFLLVLLSLISVSCTGVPVRHYTPDGRQSLRIVCGAAMPWSVCEHRAAQECPAGYHITEHRASVLRKELRVTCQ